MKVSNLNIVLFISAVLTFFLFGVGLFSITYTDTSVSQCHDTEIQSTKYYQENKENMKCWSSRKYDKVVIYLIDALDDYDKDKKKNAYNPFVLAYQAESKQALLAGENGDEVRYVFNSLFFDIRENLAGLTFRFNRDLSDNILLRGLPTVTKRVMLGCNGKCKRDKKAKTHE